MVGDHIPPNGYSPPDILHAPGQFQVIFTAIDVLTSSYDDDWGTSYKSLLFVGDASGLVFLGFHYVEAVWL